MKIIKILGAVVVLLIIVLLVGKEQGLVWRWRRTDGADR